MNKLKLMGILVLLFLPHKKCLANTQNALSAVLGTAPQLPKVKNATKRLETRLINIIDNIAPVDREYIAYVLVIGKMAGEGRVSTEVIGDSSIKAFSVTFTPKFEYNFNNSTINTLLTAHHSW